MQTISLSTLTTLGCSEAAVFLYPTDSLYGLGAIATQENAHRITMIKQRGTGKNYSLIAPSFDWIIEHFQVDRGSIEKQRMLWQEYYGPITILCKRKNPDFMSWISTNEYIGIRYIQHPFQEFVTMLCKPFLSTSANISGEAYNRDILTTIFAGSVDYFIENSTPMTGKGSTLIHYDSGCVTLRS